MSEELPPPTVSSKEDVIAEPEDWDIAVSAAYIRLLGGSQRVAAKAAGVSERSVRRWESCSWWPTALQEAHDRWLHKLTGKSRKSLLKGVGKDPNLALTILERLDPNLAPPKQRHEVTGVVAMFHRLTELTPQELERLEDMDDDQLARVLLGRPDDD